MSHRCSPDGAAFAVASPSRDRPERERRAALLWRGVVAMLLLAAHTVVGAFGAFLALLPAALQRGPRGRAAVAPAKASAPGAGSSREALPG